MFIVVNLENLKCNDAENSPIILPFTTNVITFFFFLVFFKLIFFLK